MEEGLKLICEERREPWHPRVCEVVGCLLQVMVVLDSDKQVGELVLSLRVHDSLVGTLPGTGSQAPG